MKVTPITLRLPTAMLKQIDKMKNAAPEDLAMNRTDLIRTLLREAMAAREVKK